ncbi:hypothetical protein [Mucilaginibacter sp. 44-25]|uniref:hypothetical protein n=1 Tax=Mucilaginibacter sp. 44-25 TaxID=1895794 RepID=UPI000962D07F|nr:hypothetical protein [Mucilaginibacter sp. 44-25]OJW15892.1 MAG: hypothetical protein BGO48_04260 [Mucilaginibacter sp. 44-25]PMP65301.1 MAG: hypothetical protein C0191_04025 [Mucilaginibacter sp.]HEK21410.1 hypothetical protein [Bacteroidota bacterium]
MNVEVRRYSLATKSLLGKGTLTKSTKGQTITLTYVEGALKLEASALCHPLKALEKLRLQLEEADNSVLNIIGCRSDVAYKPNGVGKSYMIEAGKQATMMVSLFDLTEDLDNLTTVAEHKTAYHKWIDSLAVLK